MHRMTRFALSALVIALSSRPLPAAEEKERQFIAVLQSNAPKSEKAMACKRLAIYGTKDAVPALAALLPDAELTSWARIALEAIPGPEADEALRAAMGKTHGRTLAGVINSIGVRRDPKAFVGLAALLSDPDVEVASSAAVALGHIGDARATAALERALAGASAQTRSAIAEGCILCAEKLLADGKADEAAKLYDTVRTADVAKGRVIDATRGAILARKSAGVPLLAEQLASADKAFFAIGLSTARELAGREVTEALAAAVSRATPERQALLLLCLADRDDATVLPAVLQAARSGSSEVKAAAIGVLRRVGDASCIPALLEAAAADDEELAAAARSALEGLPGENVNADLAARLPDAQGKAREILIEMAGRRRIDAAIPALKKAADDADGRIRSAALKALGLTVGPRELAFLIAKVVAPKNDEDTEAAERALRTACVRMPDREACAAELTAALEDVPESTKATVLKKRWDQPTAAWRWMPASPRSTLLEILGALGGAKALDTVKGAAKDVDPELRETAIYVLNQWLSTDAAPLLLDLAKTAREEKHRIAAMSGYIRIAAKFDMPDAERAAMCRAALSAAKRDEEKKSILAIVREHPSVDMLKVAVDAAKEPALKDEAAGIALAMAQRIGGESADVQTLLAQIGQEPVKIEIIEAKYGAGTTFKDVTEILRRSVRGFPLLVLSSPSYNAGLGGDPAPGIVKELKIRYRIDGKEGQVSLREDAPIVLPIPK